MAGIADFAPDYLRVYMNALDQSGTPQDQRAPITEADLAPETRAQFQQLMDQMYANKQAEFHQSPEALRALAEKEKGMVGDEGASYHQKKAQQLIEAIKGKYPTDFAATNPDFGRAGDQLGWDENDVANLYNIMGRFRYTGNPEEGYDIRDTYEFMNEETKPIYEKHGGKFGAGMAYDIWQKMYGGSLNPTEMAKAIAEAKGLSALGATGVPVQMKIGGRKVR